MARRVLGRPAARLALAVGTLLAGGASAAAGQGLPALLDDPLEGRALFESKHCHECHGLAGSGPSIAPALGEGHFAGSFLDLGAALWNHVPGMGVTFERTGTPWPELNEGETVQLISFLYFIDYLGRPGEVDRGERVFRVKGCSSCHTLGEGESGEGPDLSELQRFASPVFVAQEIWNHGPTMLASMQSHRMSAPSFEAGDLADLSAFIREAAPDRPTAGVFLSPGNPNRGRELFRSKGCATCHGQEAGGGLGGPDLHLAELHESAEAIAGRMWSHALEMHDIMLERGVGWPRFDESELADLLAYLYFLPFQDPGGDPVRGAEVFRDRFCGDCHGGERQAGETPEERGGPALEGSAVAASPAALVAAMWSHAPIMKHRILAEGRPWPELSGQELRDVRAYLLAANGDRPEAQPGARLGEAPGGH